MICHNIFLNFSLFHKESRDIAHTYIATALRTALYRRKKSFVRRKLPWRTR